MRSSGNNNNIFKSLNFKEMQKKVDIWTQQTKQKIIQSSKLDRQRLEQRLKYLQSFWKKLNIGTLSNKKKKQEFKNLAKLPFQQIIYKLLENNINFYKGFLKYMDKNVSEFENRATPQGLKKFRETLTEMEDFIMGSPEIQYYLKKDENGEFERNPDGSYILIVRDLEFSSSDRKDIFKERSRLSAGFDVKLNQDFGYYSKGTEGSAFREYWDGISNRKHPEILFQVEIRLTNKEGKFCGCDFEMIPIEYLDCYDDYKGKWGPALRTEEEVKTERKGYFLGFEINPYEEHDITLKNNKINNDNPEPIKLQNLAEALEWQK